MTDRLGNLATVVLTAPNASYDIHSSSLQRKKLTALQRRGVDQQPESSTRSTSSGRLNPRRPQDHECNKPPSVLRDLVPPSLRAAASSTTRIRRRIFP